MESFEISLQENKEGSSGEKSRVEERQEDGGAESPGEGFGEALRVRHEAREVLGQRQASRRREGWRDDVRLCGHRCGAGRAHSGCGGFYIRDQTVSLRGMHIWTGPRRALGLRWVTNG